MAVGGFTFLMGGVLIFMGLGMFWAGVNATFNDPERQSVKKNCHLICKSRNPIRWLLPI